MYQSLEHFELESCWEGGLQYSINLSSASFQGRYCFNLTISCELYHAKIDIVNNFLKQLFCPWKSDCYSCSTVITSGPVDFGFGTGFWQWSLPKNGARMLESESCWWIEFWGTGSCWHFSGGTHCAVGQTLNLMSRILSMGIVEITLMCSKGSHKELLVCGLGYIFSFPLTLT